MAKEFKLTPERLKELQDELTYLKTVREKEVAELIKEARSFGDLSENSEYDEAKTEQGKLYSRIAEVENILSNYVVIEENEDDGGSSIRLGSTVTVLDKEFNEEETYKIVGSQEADPMNGAISEDSPFGKALLGKNTGDQNTGTKLQGICFSKQPRMTSAQPPARHTSSSSSGVVTTRACGAAAGANANTRQRLLCPAAVTVTSSCAECVSPCSGAEICVFRVFVW